MSDVQTFKTKIGDKELTIETGRLAQLANASCTARIGDTQVLATAVKDGKPREDIDYFPLMVDYEERMYAAGKISGSRFIKREGRPTEEAVLTSRLIDRTLRPLFDQRIREDIQVVITVLSIDDDNDPDVVALIAASTALTISDIPWGGPVGAIRVNSVNGELVLNNFTSDKAKDEPENELDVFVAGTKDDVVMLETDAKQVEEERVYGAIELGMKQMGSLVEFIESIRKKIGKKKKPLPEPTPEEQADIDRVKKVVEDAVGDLIQTVFGIKNKEERQAKLDSVLDAAVDALGNDETVTDAQRSLARAHAEQLFADAVRRRILDTGERVDGRKPNEIRTLSADVGVLPRTHGSGLFQRGETQVLSAVTLASPGAEQLLDTMEIDDGKKRFMHHYNFPAFSVGETAPMRGPGRREIGHGVLAEKALRPVVPAKKDFAYTIRVVSEVLASNGSSSQASICGSTLGLMDAGVPILAPVAGIAMGLYMNDDKSKHTVLTDIQGIEDHDGDMDFKVAGTRQGVTAMQLDVKLSGISLAIIKETLDAAREARLQILTTMEKVISAPREKLSEFAPRIETLEINPDRVRDLIGPGGKMINKIIDETGVDIDIEDGGIVHVTSVDGEGMKVALEMIDAVTRDVEPGEEYEGTVTQIVKDRNSGGDIGALVEVLPGKVGMVHISALDWKHVEHVTDVLNIGDKVKVKVMSVDREKGRIELSRKEFIPKPEGYEERPRGRGDRPERRGGPRGFSRRDDGPRGSRRDGSSDRPHGSRDGGPRPLPRRRDA